MRHKKSAASDWQGVKVIHPNAAGLDIGSEEIWGAVPPDGTPAPVRMFGTFTPDLYALADWLAACGVDTVAMESTGVYWIPIYEVLEERGFQVYVVNARHLKNVPGRKSDIQDCQWIQGLHSVGLLRGSFRPAGEIVALRAYLRHRAALIAHRAAHIQHMQKALQQMNVQLTQVLSDITGVTGLAIIRAIVAGQRDPQQLATMRQPGCKRDVQQIAKALTGNYRREHLFALQQALALYDFYTEQLAACDAQYVSLESVPPDMIESEKAIYRAQVAQSDKPKPENIVEKIVEGKLKTWAAEACLLEQPFFKDPDVTIGEMLQQLISKTGENCVIRRFERYVLAEEFSGGPDAATKRAEQVALEGQLMQEHSEEGGERKVTIASSFGPRCGEEAERTIRAIFGHFSLMLLTSDQLHSFADRVARELAGH